MSTPLKENVKEILSMRVSSEKVQEDIGGRLVRVMSYPYLLIDT